MIVQRLSSRIAKVPKRLRSHPRRRITSLSQNEFAERCWHRLMSGVPLFMCFMAELRSLMCSARAMAEVSERNLSTATLNALLSEGIMNWRRS
ncbi:hypothetical protein E0H47_10300 [Rhizobium leguminosarum bv. viciae]|uniref:hypothetical protein n=1 Tax=Rhizobium leguminosarum TaxID=384 RepID=UPI001040539B|nr:hypothetical protein [Rhizobium leguminosarum]TBZ41665.1 hypothetical protein E0H47_10300 [Rhizobium leguminosarum bv. viciae]TBZ57113.1 hypothetical protein E0H48_16745 [Rhizobium leguminosarum bv. viciae]